LILWLLSSRHSLSFDLGSAWPVWHAVQNRCGADATRIEIFAKVRMCLVIVIFQVTMVDVEAGGLPSPSSAYSLQRSSRPLAPAAEWRRGPPTPRRAQAFGTLSKRTAS